MSENKKGKKSFKKITKIDDKCKLALDTNIMIKNKITQILTCKYPFFYKIILIVAHLHESCF